MGPGDGPTSPANLALSHAHPPASVCLSSKGSTYNFLQWAALELLGCISYKHREPKCLGVSISLKGAEPMADKGRSSVTFIWSKIWAAIYASRLHVGLVSSWDFARHHILASSLLQHFLSHSLSAFFWEHFNKSSAYKFTSHLIEGLILHSTPIHILAPGMY